MVKNQQTTAEVAWGQILKRLSSLEGFIQRNQAQIVRWLSVLVIVLYMFAQVRVGFPSFDQGKLVRDDDAYGEMLKAAELRDGCFTQDCPALNDIRLQVTAPAEDPDIAGIRNRIYHRLFVVYHPLHSALLVGLDRIGIPFETGYGLLQAAGKILIAAAVVYFVFSLWGPEGSILALLLLTPTLFFGPGLHIVKSHSFVAGISLLLWAAIYRKRSWATYGLPIFVVGICLMHPLGLLTSLVAIGLLLAISDWPMPRKTLIATVLSLLVIGSFIALPSLVTAPEMNFNPITFFPGEWNYWADLATTWPISWGEVVNWGNAFGGFAFVVALLLVAFLTRPKPALTHLLVLFMLVGGLVAGSLVYVVPWYGDISFVRVWPFAAILMTSGVAAGLVQVGRGLLLDSKAPKTRRIMGKTLNWKTAGKKFAALALTYVVVSYLGTNVNNYFAYMASTKEAGQEFNPSQVHLIDSLETDDKTDTILYMDEFAMHYYLTYGGLSYGAIYFPALRLTPQLDFWLRERESTIRYVVNRNPVYHLPHNPNGGIRIVENEQFHVILASTMDSNEMQVLFGAREDEVTIQVLTNSSAERLQLPAGPAEWVSIPVNDGLRGDISLKVPDDRPQIEILGIRFSETNSTTAWPWDQGVSISYEDADGNSSGFLLETDRIVAPLSLDISVIDDRGPFILGQVTQTANN